MFTVEDIDDTLARLSKLGATVVDEVVNYEDIYRLCYIRVPKEFSSARRTARAADLPRESHGT
jgi:hypothetical protein